MGMSWDIVMNFYDLQIAKQQEVKFLQLQSSKLRQL
jgi:hypothetical protein